MTESRQKIPLRIGLTGGIASGKSLVADAFRDLGASVIDTDIIAREVVQPGQPALEEIQARFGDSVIDKDGGLNRGEMRKLVFSDEDARHDLEAILHPRIGAETRRQADTAGSDYQVVVVPLLTSSALRDFVDRVLVVDCDPQTQIERVVARDGGTVEQAQRILAAQASREDRLAIADDIIVNDGEISATRTRVKELDQRYRQLAALRYPPESSR